MIQAQLLVWGWVLLCGHKSATLESLTFSGSWIMKVKHKAKLLIKLILGKESMTLKFAGY